MGKLESAVMKTKKLNCLIGELNILYEKHKQQRLVVTTKDAWLQRIHELESEKRKHTAEIARNSENAIDLLIKARDLSPLKIKDRHRLVTQAKGYINEVEVSKECINQMMPQLAHAQKVYDEIINSYPEIEDDFDNTTYLYWEKWKECRVLAMSIDLDMGSSISQLFSVREVSRFGEITLNDITSITELEVQDETADENQFTIDDISDVFGQKEETEDERSIYDEGDDFDVYV